ncbi:MAG TPA: EamA family transporter [Clostridiales bacterium]|nr:EamA family transporter [Clostridiales bacterium]
MYIVLSLISGVLLGFFYIAKKQVLKKSDVIAVLAVYTVINSLINCVDYKVAFETDKTILIYIFIKAVIIYIGWMLSGKAIKELPLSISSPLGILSPVFTVIIGILILHEELGILQIVGILIIFGSYYFIGRVGKAEVGDIFKNIYVYYMAIAMFLGAISATMDKLLLKDVKVEQLQFWFYLFMSILYMITILIINFIKKYQNKPLVKFEFTYMIIIVGVLLYLADKIYFYAVKFPDSNISIVMPLRYVSIIISTILGGIIFKEQNISLKFKYMIGIVIGIVLIFI